ncbi:hypothetical protein MP638_005924 [Amoeboaphelidium occidentale]|nr:hypothetical protein MP638_005924 [Amoeboaphelidium occidentale]
MTLNKLISVPKGTCTELNTLTIDSNDYEIGDSVTVGGATKVSKVFQWDKTEQQREAVGFCFNCNKYSGYLVTSTKKSLSSSFLLAYYGMYETVEQPLFNGITSLTKSESKSSLKMDISESLSVRLNFDGSILYVHGTGSVAVQLEEGCDADAKLDDHSTIVFSRPKDLKELLFHQKASHESLNGKLKITFAPEPVPLMRYSYEPKDLPMKLSIGVVKTGDHSIETTVSLTPNFIKTKWIENVLVKLRMPDDLLHGYSIKTSFIEGEGAKSNDHGYITWRIPVFYPSHQHYLVINSKYPHDIADMMHLKESILRKIHSIEVEFECTEFLLSGLSLHQWDIGDYDRFLRFESKCRMIWLST